MRLRRKLPFADVVERQLDLFATEHAGLMRDCEAALRAYDAAPAGEAEERYGAYCDLVDTGRELLEEIRDAYALALDEEAATEYRSVFNERARKRYPRFALELD